MHMAIGVEKHVIWLYVPVDDALPVNIPQCAAQLGYPKPDCILGKRFSRDVEPQVSATH